MSKFVVPLKKYFKKENENCFAIFIEGQRPINLNKIIPKETFGAGMGRKRESALIFFPDIYRMDEEEWRRFSKKAKILLYPKIKHKEMIDPESEEIESNYHESMIPIGKKLEIEYEKYRDFITQRVQNPRRKEHVTSVSNMVMIKTIHFTEFYDPPEGIN